MAATEEKKNTAAANEADGPLKTLKQLYESDVYKSLKDGLEAKNYTLNELLVCKEIDFRAELAKHGITGIDAHTFIEAAKRVPTAAMYEESGM